MVLEVEKVNNVADKTLCAFEVVQTALKLYVSFVSKMLHDIKENALKAVNTQSVYLRIANDDILKCMCGYNFTMMTNATECDLPVADPGGGAKGAMAPPPSQIRTISYEPLGPSVQFKS